MKIYFAADHAGFELKSELLNFVRGEMGFEVEDCGALQFDVNDDYPEIIAHAARKLSADIAAGKESRAVVIGASGQGEAMVANRFAGVRCGLYYGEAGQQSDAAGEHLDMIASMRKHNNANALSLAARFISSEQAHAALRAWLTIPFSNEERHARRVAQIETAAHA